MAATCSGSEALNFCSSGSSSVARASHFLKKSARLLASCSAEVEAFLSIACCSALGRAASIWHGCPALMAAFTNSSGLRGMPHAEIHSVVWLASESGFNSPPDLGSPLLTAAKVTRRSWAPAGSTRNTQEADGGRGKSGRASDQHDLLMLRHRCGKLRSLRLRQGSSTGRRQLGWRRDEPARHERISKFCGERPRISSVCEVAEGRRLAAGA